MNYYLIVLLSVFLLFACESPSESNEKVSPTEIDSVNDQEEQIEEQVMTLKESAQAVLNALSTLTFDQLTLFEPEKKDIVFSPYLTFNKNDAACLSIPSLKQNHESDAVLYWGIQDGKGDALNMTVGEYFKRYVNRGDYLSENVEIIENGVKTIGNSINSIQEFFPDAEFVSFYIPHDKDDAAEMTWKTLVLVFKNIDGKYQLKAVINHEWTI